MIVYTGRRTTILSCSALALGIIAPAVDRAQGEAGDEMVPHGARTLFDQDMWDKYELAEMAEGDFKTNTLIARKASPSELSDFDGPKSAFGPAGNFIGSIFHERAKRRG